MNAKHFKDKCAVKDDNNSNKKITMGCCYVT